MIGSFSFAEDVGPDCVGVAMSFGSRAQRLGTLIVPSDTLAVMRAANYPTTEGPLPLETALAYALTIAMKADRRLVLTGDASVWQAKWGQLTSVQQADRASR